MNMYWQVWRPLTSCFNLPYELQSILLGDTKDLDPL